MAEKSGLSEPPEIIRFDAVLFRRGSLALLEIPNKSSQKLRGMEKVEGMMNGQPFRAVIELGESGNYLLHVGTAMLRGADANIGDRVQLAILGPEPEPIPPSDLQNMLNKSPLSVKTWGTLTTLGKRDWLRWIDDTKNPETRARRMARTIDQLSEGKRRACCVNVNAYMMLRIMQDEKMHEKDVQLG